MNDEPLNPPDVDELRDRLIDRGLRELLSGETPADLSERILAAAGGQSAMATQTLGGEAMNGHDFVGGRSKSRWGWAQFAVAATLLIGASAAFMVSQVKHIDSAQRTAAKASSRATSNQMAGAAEVAADGKQTTDFNSLIDTVTSTVESEAWNKESSGSAIEPNFSIVAGQSLAVHDAKQAKGQGGGGQAAEAISPTPASSMGLQGIINDGYSAGISAGKPVVAIGGEGRAVQREGKTVRLEQLGERQAHQFYYSAKTELGSHLNSNGVVAESEAILPGYDTSRWFCSAVSNDSRPRLG